MRYGLMPAVALAGLFGLIGGTGRERRGPDLASEKRFEAIAGSWSSHASARWPQLDRLFEWEEGVLRVMGEQTASEKHRNPWTSVQGHRHADPGS
jgi:hypothetical protein